MTDPIQPSRLLEGRAGRQPADEAHLGLATGLHRRLPCAALVWLTGVFALSALRCGSVGPRLGATFDEPTYVASGLERWRTWRLFQQQLQRLEPAERVDTFLIYDLRAGSGQPQRRLRNLE